MAAKNWPLYSVTPDTDTPLASNASGMELMIFNLTVGNYHGSNASTVSALLYESDGITPRAYLLAPMALAAGKTISLDTKLFCSDEEVLKVKSVDHGSVSFMASGDES